MGRAVVAVEHRPGQTAADGLGGLESVLDELGAHVVGDGPADNPAGVTVDHGRQIQVLPVGQRQVGDVADVALVRRGGGEVPLQQVGHLVIGRFGDRGADPAAAPVAGDAVLAHHPGRRVCG
jgi:hypothetical protein